MIKLECPVIVEGKYDKITLENIVDALIIPTNGFGIFKDKEKRQMIRCLAERNGIIVMTDSDSAGNIIRSHIKSIVGKAKIINVYLPPLMGKEKRKNAPSKEGLLGVEGYSKEDILRALEKSGVTSVKMSNNKKITKTDMFLLGLSGGESSSFKRQRLLKEMQLPQCLSPNAMLEVINTLFTYEEFIDFAERRLKLGTF